MPIDAPLDTEVSEAALAPAEGDFVRVKSDPDAPVLPLLEINAEAGTGRIREGWTDSVHVPLADLVVVKTRAQRWEEHERLGPMHPRYANTYQGWEGYLTTANAAAVRDRMVRDFGDKRFTAVVVNGFFRFRPEVRPSCRIERVAWTDGSKDLIRLSTDLLADGRPWAHIMWSAGHYSWGIDSTARIQDEAHTQPERARTRLTFTHERGVPQLTIEQFTPAGDRIFWTLIAERPLDTDD